MNTLEKELINLEIQYHKNAISNFYKINAIANIENDYELRLLNEDKDLDMSMIDYVRHYKDIVELNKEDIVEINFGNDYYSKENWNYINVLEEIVNDEDTSTEEILKKIKQLEVSHNILFFYDYSILKIKNRMSNLLIGHDIITIQAKEFLNVNDFELLFSFGIESQKKFRTNKIYPLKIFSGKGNKVLYRKIDCIQWFERRDSFK